MKQKPDYLCFGHEQLVILFKFYEKFLIWKL